MKREVRIGFLIGFALLVLVGLVLTANKSPMETFSTLLQGSLGSPFNITGTLRETTPLLIAGVGVFIALRAGLFNIGIEGQFIVGAMVSAVVAVKFPGVAGIVLALVAGSIAGALWAYPAAWIKAYRGGHEVISTIMLNQIAVFFTKALVAGPFIDKSQQSPSTASVTAASRLPAIDIFGVQLSLATILGVTILSVGMWWLSKTTKGYELKATGANPTAAKFAGINTQQVTILAMLLSGAIGGFAGGLQVLAFEGRFYDGFSPGYGFSALGVALLAGVNMLAVIPAALLFGILEKGGTSLATMLQMPKGITTVVLGLLILVAAAIRYRKVPDAD